jgi:hypothetical protein
MRGFGIPVEIDLFTGIYPDLIQGTGISKDGRSV